MGDSCEKCGKEWAVGDFPFCKGAPEDHGAWRTAEEPCEAWYDEMVSTDGETFTSTRDWVRYLDKNHIVPRDKSKRKGAGVSTSLFFDMGGKR